jgi:hypothetical protein
MEIPETIARPYDKESQERLRPHSGLALRPLGGGL